LAIGPPISAFSGHFQAPTFRGSEEAVCLGGGPQRLNWRYP